MPVAAHTDHDVETQLLKPLRGEVRIHWQAQVLEPGGAFIVYRGQGSDLEEVARLAADGSGDYEFVDHAWRSGRSTYQLRYRGSDRSELVLVTSTVRLEVIESSPAAGWLAGQAAPMTLAGTMKIRSPIVIGPSIAPGPATAGDFSREPPTPPPRWCSAQCPV